MSRAATGQVFMRLPLSTVIGQEGIVAKRLVDPYGPRTKWKILNRDYSQNEDRHELFRGVETSHLPQFVNGLARQPAVAQARWDAEHIAAATRAAIQRIPTLETL
jgi:hypothetical protein